MEEISLKESDRKDHRQGQQTQKIRAGIPYLFLTSMSDLAAVTEVGETEDWLI